MPTTLVNLKHGYDQASNRLYRRDEVARGLSESFDELYAYDGLHRLTSFDRGQLNGTNNGLSSGPTISQDWTLDPLGNWNRFQQGVVGTLDQTREHNPVNEITEVEETVGATWPTPVYDANGNSTNFPQPRALTDSYTAKYDAWNRLVKLTNDADDDKTVAEFAYDGLNRRTVKKVYAGGTLDHTRHYYFSDQWQVLEERVDSDTSADRQYVWGQRYVDDLILRDHDSTRLYALSDALFNVVALTDDDGAVAERFAYQPYAESEELDPDFANYSGTDYKWEYRFTGRELDLESGLQLNRNRYLHQQLGRWVARDPIGDVLKESNLYCYVENNPTRNSDPLGLVIFCVGGGGFFGWWAAGSGSLYYCWDFLCNPPGRGLVTCAGGGGGGGAGGGAGPMVGDGCVRKGHTWQLTAQGAAGVVKGHISGGPEGKKCGVAVGGGAGGALTIEGCKTW